MTTSPFDSAIPPAPQQQQVDPQALLKLLNPEHEITKKISNHIVEKINASAQSMRALEKQWERAENSYYAYVNRSARTNAAAEANDRGESPEVIDIQIPYSWATCQTIISYWLHVFCGAEKPFTLKGIGPEDMKRVPMVEKMLQIELEQSAYVDKFRQAFLDSLIYGFAAMRTTWDTKYRKSTVNGVAQFSPIAEGTKIENIDPYKFYPDPRVPIARIAKEGEFVFWQDFVNPMILRIAQAEGKLMWTENIPESGNDNFSSNTLDGFNRNRRLGLANNEQSGVGQNLKQLTELHQGTILLDLKDFGFGNDYLPQKYMVTIANKSRIIQFEPYNADHDMHPVVVCEPYSQGYTFSSPGIVEMIADLQQLMSWFENSRIFNVRASTSGRLVIDTKVIDAEDVKHSEPGKVIKFKNTAQGSDVRQAIMHLTAPDTTSSHARDLQTISAMGDQVTAVNDVLRGHDDGKEQTATEVNTKQTNAANRLASLARIISSQMMSPLAEQMIRNRQQYMSLSMMLDEDQESVAQRESFAGDFRFMVHDGTLPQARQQEIAVLRDSLQAVIQLPDFAVEYKVGEMFEDIAEKSGIDMKRFRRTPEEKQKYIQARQQEQGPDPEQQKIELERQKAIADLKMAWAKAQAEIQIMQMKANADAQAEARKAELEKQKIDAENKLKQDKQADEHQESLAKIAVQLSEAQNKKALNDAKTDGERVSVLQKILATAGNPEPSPVAK